MCHAGSGSAAAVDHANVVGVIPPGKRSSLSVSREQPPAKRVFQGNTEDDDPETSSSDGSESCSDDSSSGTDGSDDSLDGFVDDQLVDEDVTGLPRQIVQNAAAKLGRGKK